MSDPVKTIDEAWKRQATPEVWAEIDRLTAALAAMTKERDAAADSIEALIARVNKAEMERDAANARIAKVFEVIEDRATYFNRLRDPGMANHCRALAAKIRVALNADTKGEPTFRKGPFIRTDDLEWAERQRNADAKGEPE